MKRGLKLTKQNKGFTLIEVLTALSLLMVIVFAFSPFLLKTLDDIYFAGQRRAEIFEDKARVERVLALHGEGLTPEELRVAYYDAEGNSYTPVYTVGVNIQEGDITAFYSNTDPSMTLIPLSVNEGYPANTTVEIVGTFLNFTDAGHFKLRENINGNVVSTSGCFTLSETNPGIATFKLPAGLNMAGSPYGVYYGDTYAPLKINPPAMVAVGASGSYFAGNGEGLWSKQNFPSNSNITTQRLNDVAWSGYQYLIPANGGKLYFSQGGWESATQTTSAGTWGGVYYNQVSDPDITAVHHSTVFDEYYSAATFTGEFRLIFSWVKDTYGYITSGSTAEDLDEDPDPDGLLVNFTAMDTLSSGLSRGNNHKILLTGGKYTTSGSKGFIYYQNKDTGVKTTVLKDSSNAELHRIKEIQWVDTPGAELFKAVGNNNSTSTSNKSKIYSSTDGLNWVSDTLPSNNDRPIVFNSICFGADKWVAVGNSNWALIYNTAASTPSWQSVKIRSTSAVFNRVSYVGGKFYACGDGGLIFSSENGTTWVQEATGSTLALYGIQGR